MTKYEELKKKYSKIIYVTDQNNFGNVHYIFKNTIIKELKNYGEFLEYIIYSCLEALKISKKYNKTTYNVHIYTKNAGIKNFSLKLFKYINNILQDQFEDTVEKYYFYNSDRLFTILFNLIGKYFDQESRAKFVIISNN